MRQLEELEQENGSDLRATYFNKFLLLALILVFVCVCVHVCVRVYACFHVKYRNNRFVVDCHILQCKY